MTDVLEAVPEWGVALTKAIATLDVLVAKLEERVAALEAYLEDVDDYRKPEPEPNPMEDE